MTSPDVRQSLPPAFWRLWTASAISNLGDGVFLVALPLLATQLTRDPIQISLIAVAGTLPWLLLSLPAGAVVDRYDRRWLMVAADVFRTAVVATFTVIVVLDMTTMWMLWVLALLLGTAEVVFDNASQAILPEVVPPELLDRANGRKYSIDTTTNLFLGTPLGGVLFALAIWVPFGVDAVSFAVAALLVLGLRGRFVPDDVPARRPTTLRTEMGEGLRWLWRHRLLRALAVAVALVNIGFQMGQGIFVLYARQELGVDEHWFGVLLAVMGTGAIAGGLLAERIVARIGQVFALYSAIVIWALAILSYAVAPYVVVVTVMAGLLGFATTVWNVVSVGLRQSIVPHRLFGRVNSVFRWFALGAMPLGALLGGVLADVLGLRQAYAVGAFVVALAIVAMAGQVRRDPIERAMAAATAARALERDPTPQHGLADPLLD